jgi:hypothetical protein
MENPKIDELMVPLKEYAQVSGEATLQEALKALDTVRDKVDWRKFKHRAVLVTDEAGRIVGKVRPVEVMANLDPGYRKLGDPNKAAGENLSLVALKSMIDKHGLWRNSLAEACRQAAFKPVKEIMYRFTDAEFIPINTPIEEAVHNMIVGRRLSLLVTRGGEVTGVLRLTDVFTEVGGMIRTAR